MRRGRPRHADILTPREWEVLNLIAEGLTNEQIGERLGISLSAVKYHVGEVLSKLNASGRQDAVRIAEEQRRGLRALAPLLWLRNGLPTTPLSAAAVVGFAVLGVVALVALTAGSSSPPDPVTASINSAPGLDVASFDRSAFERTRLASPYQHTVLVATSIPDRYSPEDLAVLQSIARVDSLAQLQQVMTSAIRLIVVDSSAAEEFAENDFLYQALEDGLAVVTLNVCLDQVSFRGTGYPAPTRSGPVHEISPEGTVTVNDTAERSQPAVNFCDEPINQIDVARFHFRRIPTEVELETMREDGVLHSNHGLVHANSAVGGLKVVIIRLDAGRDGNVLDPICGVGQKPRPPEDPDCYLRPSTP
jgi:DNA-binding CsgD family transcriptional regulator